MTRPRRRTTNSIPARGISVTEPTKASWRAFDALPPAVRHLLWEAPVSLNPRDAAALVEVGEEYAIDVLVSAGLNEARKFAAQHLEKFGYALPAAAADATFQPYEGPVVRPLRAYR